MGSRSSTKLRSTTAGWWRVRRVQLLKDQSEADRFGRLLRYVFAGDILVNAELVREGLAEAKRYEPDVKFADCFDALMQEARDNKRGLWGP